MIYYNKIYKRRSELRKCKYITLELINYRRRLGEQVMLCACVTPLYLSGEHWSLTQRYLSHVFAT
jgi:hypothetical protein